VLPLRSRAHAGYLFADAQFDELMGRSAWMRIAGHALADDVDADLYHELYAAAAGEWLSLGCFNHYISYDRRSTGAGHLVCLSFGQQQAHACVQFSSPTLAD